MSWTIYKKDLPITEPVTKNSVIIREAKNKFNMNKDSETLKLEKLKGPIK